MSWRDSAALQAVRDRERARREYEANAAERRAEDDCFRLMRSRDERQRIEGYSRHAALLARRHQITVEWLSYRPADGGRAFWDDRRIRVPAITTEGDAKTFYHEIGHILEGRCPNDGVVHRWSDSCLACETAAWRRARSLAPFSSSMDAEAGQCLKTYRTTPAAAAQIQELHRVAGSVSGAEARLRWTRWWSRVDAVARWKAEAGNRRD